MSVPLDPATLAALWRRARAMFARAAAIIGPADALASLEGLTRKRAREISGWLALVETVVRKLIFTEAARLRAVAQSTTSRPPRVEIIHLRTAFGPAYACAAPRSRASAAPQTIDLAQPETWRGQFRLALPGDSALCPERSAPRVRALWGPLPTMPAPPPPQSAKRDAAPAPVRLARRLEALRRVLVDPAPQVRRLARLMERLGPALVDRYAIALPIQHWADPADARLIVEAIAIAMAAAPLFFSSS